MFALCSRRLHGVVATALRVLDGVHGDADIATRIAGDESDLHVLISTRDDGMGNENEGASRPARSDGDPVDVAALVRAVAPAAHILECAPLTGGVSALVQAVTIEYDDARQERLVVRSHREVEGKPERAARAKREFRLLQVLHAQGARVPRPRHFAPPYTLLIDFIAGSTELPRDPTAQLALALAAIHATPTTELPELPIFDSPVDNLREFLPEGALDAKDFERCPAFSGPRRLLHGDFWPGNVMWQDDLLVAVLDWEDAALGDPLLDLAGARVELACAEGEAMAQRFTADYVAATGCDITRLPYWDLAVSTAALCFMDGWGLAPDALAARKAATTAWRKRAHDCVRAH